MSSSVRSLYNLPVRSMLHERNSRNNVVVVANVLLFGKQEIDSANKRCSLDNEDNSVLIKRKKSRNGNRHIDGTQVCVTKSRNGKNKYQYVVDSRIIDALINGRKIE